MKIKILSLMWVVALSFSFTLVQAGGVKWVKYTQENGKFSGKFPGTPKVEINEEKDSPSYKVSCEMNGVVYFMASTIHTTQIVGHESLAQASLEAFAEETGGKIVESSDWLYKKNMGKQATIRLSMPDPNKPGVTIYYRVLLIGQAQYQVVIAGENEKIDHKLKSKFFKSFKALK